MRHRLIPRKYIKEGYLNAKHKSSIFPSSYGLDFTKIELYQPKYNTTH